MSSYRVKSQFWARREPRDSVAETQVHLFHARDERVVEVWQFVDDAHASVEFWS